MSKLNLETVDAMLGELAEVLVPKTEALKANSPQARAYFGKLVGRGDDKNFDDPRASPTTFPIPRTPAWRTRRSEYGRKPAHGFDPTKMQKPRRVIKRRGGGEG